MRAPITGTVLRVEIEPGEFMGAPPARPLAVVGDVEVLHVRVDIDEHDIPRLRPRAPAVAIPRGSTDLTHPLAFVRVEPFVVPKKIPDGPQDRARRYARPSSHLQGGGRRS